MSSPFAFRVNALLDRVEHRRGYDYMFSVHDVNGGAVRLELRINRPDTFTGAHEWGLVADRIVVDTMTDGQLARALLGMFLSFEEHETREAFTIDGLRPFGPHITLEALLGAAYHTDPRPT